MRPLRLSPVYISTIWAGHRLRDIRKLEDKNIGIAREVCAYKDSENEVAEGDFKGKSITEIIEKHHSELMGQDPNNQLIRAAYIDAVEDLSIQVHPAAEFAELKGDYEKSESWYILEADQGACITAGTTISDKELLRKAAEEGTLEKYIKKIPVKAGDFALIPAGMLHACGKHMLAIEIGSFGGITYRLYDYGRPRPLDLNNGFQVLDPELSCTLTHHPLPELPGNHISNGVDHPLFHVDVIDIAETQSFNSENRYSIIVCVSGAGVIHYEAERYSLSYTQSILMPASAEMFTIEGNLRILRAYHPLNADKK